MNRLFKLALQKGCGKFAPLIITLLTAIIAAIVAPATWQLILHTFALVRGHTYETQPALVFALAAASLSLGILAQPRER